MKVRSQSGRCMRLLRLVGVVVLTFGASGFNGAAAVPITAWVTVQPIDVCADDGSNCAQPPQNLTIDEAAATKIFAQAGLQPIFLPEHTFDDSRYLTTTVDSSGNPIDQAHQLLRLSNPAASGNPTTLNAYFVDNLTQISGAPIYGYGLVGSNGAIISSGGAIDTLAHELGHNLGLLHVDGTAQDDPNNLMRSVGRNVPSSLANITPDGASDVLNASQITQMQQPLFTIDLASATVHRAGGSCTTLLTGCVFFLQFPTAATSESLLELKVRFLPGSGAGDFGIGLLGSPPASCIPVGVSTTSLVGGGLEADYSFGADCFTEGDNAELVWKYPVDFNTQPPSLVYQPPFSFEFDFSSGVTSSALYDATTDTVSSTGDVTLGFNGDPIYGIGVSIPDQSTAPIDTDGNAAPVPEPAASLLLASALAALAAVYAPRVRWYLLFCWTR